MDYSGAAHPPLTDGSSYDHDEFELDNEISCRSHPNQSPDPPSPEAGDAAHFASNISVLSQRLSTQRDLLSAITGKAASLRERYGLNASSHLIIPGATSDTSSIPSTSATSTPSIPPAEPNCIQASHQQQEQNVKYLDLQKEVQVLNQIIKQYESTLDIVMGKLRAQAVTAQREKMELQVKLQKALDDERAISQSLRTENAILQSRLDDAFRAIREALGAASEDLTDLFSSNNHHGLHTPPLST
ncbi:hypothetical protein SeLEV6574_g03846 [Synchytrium endobioticum]|uniref:Uncharacterized protein n=1 Tax=Synchytrium endobioticum TaxID=286115 RepID=A0A507D2K2_9FUNG|nr:hypothetical protein SeLEV6574_g03846 [Synchytrium endobioticum]